MLGPKTVVVYYAVHAAFFRRISRAPEAPLPILLLLQVAVAVAVAVVVLLLFG